MTLNRYVALLRGINVGGNNKVSMPLLKELFEKAGFENVKTYINSGNVLFSARESNVNTLREECEQLILNGFGLNVQTVVLSARDYESIVSRAPLWWNSNSEEKHNAIFVIPPLQPEEIVSKIGFNPEYEKVYCCDSVIFWSASLKHFSKTKISGISSTKEYGSVTVRNANTFLKIRSILNECGKQTL